MLAHDCDIVGMGLVLEAAPKGLGVVPVVNVVLSELPPLALVPWG